MVGVLVPEQGPIAVVHSNPGEDSLSFEQRMVGGLIEKIVGSPGSRLDRGDITVWGNEEARFMPGMGPNDRARRFLGWPPGYDFVGPMLIVGYDPQTGTSLDAPDDVALSLVR